MTAKRIQEQNAAGSLTGAERLAGAQLSTSVTYTGTNISAVAASRKFVRASGSWITLGLAAGDSVYSSGWTGGAANNMGARTITSLTATELFFAGDDGADIVDDAGGESVTVTKWEKVYITPSAIAAGAAPDASAVTYTPTDTTDWTGSADPGNTDDALDQLADRLKSAELTITALGGTELKGLTFTSDTGSTADSDPGAGLFKWNNATQGSATFLYFDDVTVDAINLDTFYASLGTTGFIYLQQSDDATKWQLWKWTSAPTDGTGYWKFPVTLQASGGSITDNKTVYTDFTGAGGSAGDAGKHAIPVSCLSMTPRLTNGCANIAYITGAANQPDVPFLAFDPDAVEFAEFMIPAMPKSWDEGTITFRVEWSHAATATNFKAAFNLQAVAVSNDDTLLVNFGTAIQVNDTGGTTSDLYITDESSAVTIAGTPAAEDMVLFRLSRVATDGTNDTLAVDARVHGITIYITTDASTDA